jgi:putative transcriptional regulator
MKNKIRELRKKLGVRQEDIANTLGVTRQTINAIENEKYNPTLELAMNLAKLLKIPVEELFILEVCEEPDKKLNILNEQTAGR